MNSSESRKNRTNWFIEFFKNYGSIISNTLFGIFIAGLIILLISWMCSGIVSCERQDKIESYHFLRIYYNKLPPIEEPLVINDSMIFDHESTDTLCLVFYYHYSGEVNQYRFIGIPLSKCTFTGKKYDYYNDEVNIKVQNDSLGELIYDKDYETRDIIKFLEKNPDANYIIYGNLDSIPKYIGVRKKTR